MQNKLTVQEFLQKFPCFAIPEGWELIDAPGITEVPEGQYLIVNDNSSDYYSCNKNIRCGWHNTYLLRPAYEIINSPYDYRVGDELENGRKVVSVTPVEGCNDVVTCIFNTGYLGGNVATTSFFNNGKGLYDSHKITRRNGRPVRVKGGEK